MIWRVWFVVLGLACGESEPPAAPSVATAPAVAVAVAVEAPVEAVPEPSVDEPAEPADPDPVLGENIAAQPYVERSEAEIAAERMIREALRGTSDQEVRDILAEPPNQTGAGAPARIRVPDQVRSRVHTRSTLAGSTFDRNIIERMVRRRVAVARRCHERVLRENARVEGRVDLEWVILPTGLVTGTRVASNTTGDASLGVCLQNVVRRFRFNPGPDAETRVTTAFVLAAER